MAEPRALAAQSTRAADTTQHATGTKLVKKEEDYFIGSGGKKKGKKGRKEAVLPGPEAAAAVPEAPSSSGKFNLNVGILEELAKIDVDTPMSKDDVPKTLEKLREKLAWYKEHQEIKTKEVSYITSSPPDWLCSTDTMDRISPRRKRKSKSLMPKLPRKTALSLAVVVAQLP